MEEPSLLLCDQRGFGLFYIPSLPSSLLLCSCHQVSSCAVGEEKEQCGLWPRLWGAQVRKGWLAQQHPTHPLQALSLLPARAAPHCWGPGQAINQQLPVPFD